MKKKTKDTGFIKRKGKIVFLDEKGRIWTKENLTDIVRAFRNFSKFFYINTHYYKKDKHGEYSEDLFDEEDLKYNGKDFKLKEIDELLPIPD